MLDSFIEIALNNEYSTEISKVRKWTQPIHYTITHRTSDQTLHQQLIELHLAQLADITGLEISPAQSIEQANLNIIFSTEQKLSQELKHDFLLHDKQQVLELSRHSVCLAHFSVFPDSSINRAIVIIPVDRARAHAKLLSCVVEELTQIMGLPNDSDKVFPSIFNDKSHDDYLSGLDYLLLRLLYHPSIKVGMTTAKVKTLLRKIISEDTFQQLIIDSERLVTQQGLYRLLN
ncbi:MAG: DUF2927 domain-containing protein [Gammaproteobacteria bacterium]|nr:DUF2927 domain-containing protein [Gammaproteobacteria bacterium]